MIEWDQTKVGDGDSKTVEEDHLSMCLLFTVWEDDECNFNF